LWLGNSITIAVLTEYKKKRTLNKTPEPRGGRPSGGHLRFVVQKHDASRLHYDFRLEADGVLKSWAVPKGPSMDPSQKRLAVQVEDHPFDYRTFEGTIPKGNYGAGTVMVWDEGTFEPLDAEFKNKSEANKAVLNQVRSGKVKFALHGKKLNGAFALVKGRWKGGWLLMKMKDDHATTEDILQNDKSVLTGRTLSEIENGMAPKRKSKSKTKSR